MKLKISLQDEPKHSDLVSCVDWASVSELFSVGDDHVIMMWDLQAGDNKKLVSLPKDTFATDINWLPSGANSRGRQHGQSEVFVLACTDGRFLLVSRLGRVEKAVEAHKGAVLGARWSSDGSALLTYGEDGAVKVWSKTGMLRTVLVQSGTAVYCGNWSPESDQVIYADGKNLVIKPLKSGLKPCNWAAHDGLVLCLDWSPANGLIVSGGEDSKYKVWDCYGRNIYISYIHDSPITSVSWSPDGESFAVGAFNTLRLCDKEGWSYSLEKPSTGSILRLSWTADGTQLAGACGNGQVLFAQLVDRLLEWGNLEVTVNDNNTIDTKDVTNVAASEHLELHSRIIKVSLGWGYLIVTTTSQCHIYNATNWLTPTIIDMRSGSVAVIKQASKHFLIADDATGFAILSYDGRGVSTIKNPPSTQSAFNIQSVSLCPDTVAVKDKNNEKVVYMFDALTGKDLGSFTHHNEVASVSLSQAGPTQERLMALLDKNNDLYISSIRGNRQGFPLGSMVSSVCWNETCNMLATMQDGKFVVWCYPAVIHSDKDLLPLTKVIKEGSEFSKSPQILHYSGHHCNLRRSDGARVATSTTPFPSLLHEHVASGNWEAALRLCRFVQDPALWACLSGMAASAQQLATAEVAYAAINEVDKVQYLSYINGLDPEEKKKAELALFCQQPQQAESIYLQSNHIFRAIQLNIQLFNWERALELAVKYKTHVDTVLAYREHYLNSIGSKESLQKFQQFSGKVTIDWETIRNKVELEEGKP